MNSRIRKAVAILLIATAAQARGSDQVKVSVTVNQDGKSCAANGRSAPCTALPSFLSHELGVGLDAAVTVSPVDCGEDAAARASSVATKLREAGFSKVAVVGFLSEPNAKCAP